MMKNMKYFWATTCHAGYVVLTPWYTNSLWSPQSLPGRFYYWLVAQAKPAIPDLYGRTQRDYDG